MDIKRQRRFGIGLDSYLESPDEYIKNLNEIRQNANIMPYLNLDTGP
jgi:hypothetical protein